MTCNRGETNELDRRQCLDLLATNGRARVALSRQALPVIVPVRYRLVGDEIVIDCCTGTLAAAAAGGHIVCLETEVVDPATSIEWSVAVTGTLRRIPLRADGSSAAVLPTTTVTGCRVDDVASLA